MNSNIVVFYAFIGGMQGKDSGECCKVSQGRLERLWASLSASQGQYVEKDDFCVEWYNLASGILNPD